MSLKTTLMKMLRETTQKPKILISKKTTKKKHMIDIAPGQHGAKLARKKVSKMKKRGQVKKGQRVLRKSRGGVRKKKQLCAF